MKRATERPVTLTAEGVITDWSSIEVAREAATLDPGWGRAALLVERAEVEEEICATERARIRKLCLDLASQAGQQAKREPNAYQERDYAVRAEAYRRVARALGPEKPKKVKAELAKKRAARKESKVTK